MEHKGNEIDWHNTFYNKYYVYYNYQTHTWCTSDIAFTYEVGLPYFLTSEIAKNAIKEIVEPFMAEHPGFKL